MNKIDKNNSKLALFKCDCGSYKEIDKGDWKNGHTQSCGCALQEYMAGQIPNNILEEDEIPVGRAKDLTGQHIGNCTVMYRVQSNIKEPR